MLDINYKMMMMIASEKGESHPLNIQHSFRLSIDLIFLPFQPRVSFFHRLEERLDGARIGHLHNR